MWLWVWNIKFTAASILLALFLSLITCSGGRSYLVICCLMAKSTWLGTEASWDLRKETRLLPTAISVSQSTDKHVTDNVTCKSSSPSQRCSPIRKPDCNLKRGLSQEHASKPLPDSWPWETMGENTHLCCFELLTFGEFIMLPYMTNTVSKERINYWTLILICSKLTMSY